MDKRIEDEDILTQEDYDNAALMVAEPKSEKRPSNAGLNVSFWAFNIAFAVVDILSAIAVGVLSRWYYGVATVIAGAAFMFVHEYLFSRPFNNRIQNKIAVGGAVWAVLTILGIALASVIANLTGFLTPEWELYFLAFIVSVIVFNIVTHGVLAGIYYYMDDGHNAKNKSARARARAITQTEIDGAAEMILTEALRRRIKRKKMIDRFRSSAAIKAAIREAGGDEDNDGIPDVIDPIDNHTGKPFNRQPSYAQTVERPEEKGGNGNRPSQGQRQ
ncbi:MAG: hypothetical protein KPEEDBHJ_03072 [Anaerolineales bacterium]|nr:hypothetical protein [Anaerolineales bacterium]